MAINEIQMQAGMSLAQFLEAYGTETQCETMLTQGALGTRTARSSGASGRPIGSVQTAITSAACARGH